VRSHIIKAIPPVQSLSNPNIISFHRKSNFVHLQCNAMRGNRIHLIAKKKDQV
jgi:hypothetical protein